MLIALVLVTLNETVLVFRPSSQAFQDASEGLAAALEDEFQFEEYLVVRGETTQTDLAQKIEATHPHLIVLMGIDAIDFYTKYQKSKAEGTVFPPGLILMSLNAEKQGEKLKNMAVITYEIPGVNSLSQMRTLLEIPIHKVGVLYSPALEGFFKAQRELCIEEKIDLVGISIKPMPKKKLKAKHIKEGLRVLVQDLEVDAVWVLNDTNLLGMRRGEADPKIIRKGWMRSLEKNKIPVLVSVRSLMDLGHLGIFPDHYRMGEQAATLIYRIRESDWKWEKDVVQYPISTVSVLNRTLVKAHQ